MIWLSNTFSLFKRTFEECARDRTPMLAAALAFYTLLSLAPALLVLVAITGMLLGRESAKAEVIALVSNSAGAAAAGLIDDVLIRMEARSSLATVAGVASMLFGATIAFSAMQDSLNAIWKVPRHGGVIRGFVVKRLLSFGVVMLVGLLLLASIAIGTFVAAAAKFMPESLPASGAALQWVNFLASMALMTLLFGIVYKTLPDAIIHWRDVWVGAAFTSFLFTTGKTLIGLYLGYTSLGSAYGAAGSLAVFLLWVYYSAQTFLVGAEFTQVYAEAHGKSIRPRAHTEEPVAGPKG